MPKFALSGPEIDTVVAYINSLATAKTASPRKRKTVTPIADAMDIGDASQGICLRAKDLCGPATTCPADRGSYAEQAEHPTSRGLPTRPA